MTGSPSCAQERRTRSQWSTGRLEYVVLFSMPMGSRRIRSSSPCGGLGWMVLVTTAPAPEASSLRMLRSWSVRSPDPTTTGFLMRRPRMGKSGTWLSLGRGRGASRGRCGRAARRT